MTDRAISNHCWLTQVSASQTATRRGIYNEPSDDCVRRATALAVNVLDPLHDRFGAVTISSWFRSHDLNKAIGGVPTSQHCYGEAVDITIPGVALMDIVKWIAANCVFDQLIIEFDRWVHVSFTTRYRNRKQMFRAITVNGATKYEPLTA